MNYNREIPDHGEEEQGTSALVPGAAQQVRLQRDPYGSAIAYGEAAAEASHVFGFSLNDYIRIVLKRKWLILSVVGASSAFRSIRTP
jgi:hypothetical protein